LDASLRGERLHLWRGERHVLRGVNLELASGHALQLRGANGTGKTTLLRTLAALAWPEEGKVLWNGENVRRDLPAFHRALAYVGHESPLKPDLTATENLRYWVGVRRHVALPELRLALESVDGMNWADRPIRTLSAGQRRRVALAGLSLLDAPLWLLDEPTTNLDAAGQQLVCRLIDGHLGRGGMAVVALHHELAITPDRLRRLDLR
jgi:heme exporter protein A